VKPDASLPQAWQGPAPTPTSAASSTEASTQPGVDVAHWWTAFGDAALDSLVERALAANLDLVAGEAAVRAARAARASAASGQWPTLDASAEATRTSVSGAAGSGTNDLFRAGFDALWELDLFGGTRRGVEAADEDLRASVYDLRALQVSLAAEVASTYFDLRDVQGRLAIARENLASQLQTVELTRQRFASGLVGALDVHSAEAQADATRASLPAFEAQERAAMHALELLLAREPGALLEELASAAPLPQIVPAVPVGLPSDLLRRRPDIARAEAALHAATARIGVATADLYPRFALAGTLGLQGEHGGSLFDVDDHFWSFGPSLTAPLFNAGRLRANVAAQEAFRDQSLAAYQQTILAALHDVETALYALARERERHDALADGLQAQAQALELATQLYGAGRTAFLDVLNAQGARLQAQDALAESTHAIALDLVALYKALGGGWDPS